METIDNTQDDNALDVKDNRQLTQTFQVSTGFKVDKFYIDAGGIAAGQSFTLRIFEVADTNAGMANSIPTAVGMDLLNITGTTGTATGSGILEFDLTGADEITLAALTGPAGYALQFNQTSGTKPFSWLYSLPTDSGTDLYTEGRGYATVFSPESVHSKDDFTLALVAVPEPTSALLLGLGAIVMLGNRRR